MMRSLESPECSPTRTTAFPVRLPDSTSRYRTSLRPLAHRPLQPLAFPTTTRSILAGNSPNNCADYPFFGGVLDVYGVAFDIAGGNVGVLWSDGNIPGAGLVYAAGDGNANGTILDDPNGKGADQSLPTGMPVALVTSAAPEPGSSFLFGIGLLGLVGILARKGKRTVA